MITEHLQIVKRAVSLAEEISRSSINRITLNILESEDGEIFQCAFMSDENIPYELSSDGDLMILKNGNFERIGEV